jgi:hypothetical protein
MTLEGPVLIIGFLALLLELICLQIKPNGSRSTSLSGRKLDASGRLSNSHV